MVVRECKCHSAYKRESIRTIDIDYCGVYYECTNCQKSGYTRVVSRWP